MEIVSCRRDFSSPGKRFSIKPAMMAQLRNVRFISADSAKPGFQVVAQHILVEQLGEREVAAFDVQSDVAQSPNRQGIFIGDKPQRPQAGPLKPARQQHAKRLVRQSAFKRIADKVVVGGSGKGFDQ